MSTLAKLLVLFTLALSVNSLATPHVVRSPHGHRALAARMAVAEPVPAVEPYGVKVVTPKRKRGDTGRCRARSSSATGQGTFYQIGLGACGVTNGGNDKIAAVSHLLFDAFPGYDGVNPNSNPVCGKSITLTYQGKSTTVKIEDRCEACALTDIDLAPSAFEQIADFSVGRISGMTWVWND
ncbi:expansin family protein [Fomitiporia mediterranea MF3/22]|uniref:expansin family protein n=1 Tax=Fomitiporia mediterranea (strain MF3/22) TaxID=694068 RepID=UPI0004409993|nr:expansin family protein [Fomitiporia mediterranea MF3/22]EJD03837.1 expansin family protein [Fomitiporia mediterranea MF3/22]